MRASYEGFDEIRSTPYGIANTNELYVGFFNGIAADEQLDYLVETINNPPVLLCQPEYYHAVKAFGIWGLPNTNGAGAEYEEMLERTFKFYENEVEQRKWYGLFNYGDIMHTYDPVRHTWRYDVGGYAWQNTELVPTLWLWLAFMRTGRADIYKMAEAMSRHCSEVDTYHIGEYKGLGSRHNVLHWGCSCKEARIAMAGHHRYLYYITGDERLGDIFDEMKDAEYGVLNLDPLRFHTDDDHKTHVRSSPDWSSLAFNWLTAWERHGDTVCRDKLIKGIECLKNMPYRLITSSNYGFEPDTGEIIFNGDRQAGGSHLAMIMGGPQLYFELIDVFDDPVWKDMLADYGAFYQLSADEKRVYSNDEISGKGWGMPYAATTMAAFAAVHKNDDSLAQLSWQLLRAELERCKFELADVDKFSTSAVKSEMLRMSTNFASQWCLNVICCSGIIGDKTK